jgi:hypothetical protein
MISRATLAKNFDLHKVQQIVKWAVYIFLLVNWGFYIVEDWTRAAHTLTADSTFLDWTSEFATSIDESAWFILLFMFELETYILEDEEWTGWVGHTVRGIRLLCIAMIAHTVYAFFIALINIQPTVPVENVSNLCEMTSADVSFVYNLEYTEVTEETCGELSDATQFFWVADNPVVSDAEGLKLERNLALVDVIEACLWVLVLLAIEIVVRLQGKGITSGALIRSATWAQFIIYAGIFSAGIYWASLGHGLYLWDEFVWIMGFVLIEMNISEWRDEIIEEQAAAGSGAGI